MPNWKKIIVSGSTAELASVYAPSITGSLLGTASFATSIGNLNQNVVITGSLIVSASGTTNDLRIGTNKLFVSASGNIGIGTDTPNTSLHINTNSGNTIQTLSSTLASDAYIRFVRSGSNGWAVGRSNTNASFRISYLGSDQPIIGGSTDFVTISNTGNFGIGTTTPAARLDVSGSALITGSLIVTGGITGSLFGTASFANTASYVNTLNQNVLITGSLTVGASSIGASENTLTLGPRDNGSEGGQLMLQAPGGTYTSASMLDNYTNLTRLLRGTNAGSDAVVAQWNMHTKQMQLPAYNSTTAFTSTPLVGILGFDANGNILTTNTSSGGGGGGVTITNNTDNYLVTATGTSNTLNGESNLQFNGSSLTVTGQITSSGPITSQANGAMYFRGGDDAEFWDINVANTVGIYGQQNATVGSVKLGSDGGIISGWSSSIGIGTVLPNSGTLHVNGNVFATSFTGSLLGTSSWAQNAVTASYVTASNVFGPYGSNSVTTASYSIYAETASISAATTLTQILALNQTGFTITKGTVVRITGSNNASDIPRITTASYEDDNRSANTLGIMSQTILSGETGYIVTEGVLTGIDTSGYTSGTLLFLGATGSLTASAPLAPLHAVRLGQVIREQSNNGSIHVRIDNGYEIGELHDVLDTTTTSSYGDLLVKSGSVWTSTNQLTGSYGITGSLQATSFTGSLLGTASHATEASNTSTININSFGSPVESYLLMSNVVATTGVAIGGDNELRYNSSTNVLTVPNISSTSITSSLFGTASYANIAETVVNKTTYTVGMLSGSSNWISNGDGTMTLPATIALLYNNSEFSGSAQLYSIPSATTGTGGIPALTNNDTNYIFINYNSGTPTYDVSTIDISNDSNIALVYIVYRLNNFVHVLDFGNQGAGLANKISRRLELTNRIARESGLALSLSGSTGIAVIESGVAWNGTNRQQLAEVNSNDDVFFKNYRSGSLWTVSTTENFINTGSYDNGTNLVTVSSGKYLVNWYYRGQEINDHIYEVISQNEYNSLADAQLATNPILPELVSSHAFLVGRIIVQSGSYDGTVQSAFASVFQATNVTAHNDLIGLQGGSAGEYYHLTANQVNNLALTNTTNQFTTSQIITGSLTVTGSLSITSSGITSPIDVIGNINSFNELNIQNVNSGTNASSDLVATNDIGTDTGYFVDMGINSSTYSGPIGGANDAYLYTTGSNLIIGNATTGNNSNIYFSVQNAFTTPILTISSSQQVRINNSLLISGSVTSSAGNHMSSNAMLQATLLYLSNNF